MRLTKTEQAMLDFFKASKQNHIISTQTYEFQVLRSLARKGLVKIRGSKRAVLVRAK